MISQAGPGTGSAYDVLREPAPSPVACRGRCVAILPSGLRGHGRCYVRWWRARELRQQRLELSAGRREEANGRVSVCHEAGSVWRGNMATALSACTTQSGRSADDDHAAHSGRVGAARLSGRERHMTSDEARRSLTAPILEARCESWCVGACAVRGEELAVGAASSTRCGCS